MQWWRDPRWAGRLMAAWFLLSLLTGSVVSVEVSNGSAGTSILARLAGWGFSAFFAWRVTCGGRVSRMLLILAAVGGFIALVIALAIQFRLAELGQLAVLAAQAAVLLSPAVYRRTRPGGQPGETIALWRRRAPAPLAAALAAGVVLGLLGAAVSAAVMSGRLRDYSHDTVRVSAGRPVIATLSPGRYQVLGGCYSQLGCVVPGPRDLAIRGAFSGPVLIVADSHRYAERDIGGTKFYSDLTFTLPVREPVRFTVTVHRVPPVYIEPAQFKKDLLLGWAVTAACSGVLLLGSLAGLAWPVGRRGGPAWR